MSYARLKDLLQTITVLARPGGATVGEICSVTGKSRRTAYRLLSLAQELNVPLYDEAEESDRRVRRYRLEPGYLRRLPNLTMPDFQLSEADLVALYAMRALLGRGRIAPLETDADAVLGRLQALVDPERKAQAAAAAQLFLPARSLQKNYNGAADRLRVLISATIRRERLYVEYNCLSQKDRKRYTIDPLHFFVEQGSLYVFVRLPRSGNIRILAVDRIEGLSPTGVRFLPPEDFDPAAVRRAAFAVMNDPIGLVRIRFRAETARYIAERQWAPEQSIRWRKDGSAVLEMRVQGRIELQRWVQSFGGEAEVLAPASLRAAVQRELSRATSNYCRNARRGQGARAARDSTSAG